MFLASVAWRSSQLVRERETSARTARSKATRGAEEAAGVLFSSFAPRVALFLAARALVSRSLTNWVERQATLANMFQALPTFPFQSAFYLPRLCLFVCFLRILRSLCILWLNLTRWCPKSQWMPCNYFLENTVSLASIYKIDSLL